MTTLRPTTLLLLLAGLLVGHAGAQTVTRGPYLQMLSHNAITVRWQTDVAATSKVMFGDSPTNLATTASNPANTVEHELRLTGLTPDTTYFYSIGTTTTTLAGGDTTFTFKTAPIPGTSKPVRVWVLGDSGTGGDGTNRAENVRDGYYNSAHFKNPDLWLMLGDNAYDNGTEAETTRAIFQTYPTMLRRAALWSAYGNHEALTSSGAPYFNAFSFPTNAESGGTASGSERYYSFDFADIHFVCLDSQTSINRTATGPGTMLNWLADDLANTTQRWIVAFWHHPPYTKGSHDSDTEAALAAMRSNALPILESYGVDLVLCGHSHSYERSMLINGHHDVSSTFNPATMAKDTGNGKVSGTGAYQKAAGANNGAVFVVNGNSGKTSGGLLNHPIMVTSQNVLGSLILDFDGGRLDVREIGTAGQVLDEFTILKSSAGNLAASSWTSVNTHGATARALPIADNSFVEPRQAGIRRLEVTFPEDITVTNTSTAVSITGVNSAGTLSLAALGITPQVSVAGNLLSVEFSNNLGACALPDATKWRITLNPTVISGATSGALSSSAANTREVAALVGDSSGNGRSNGVDLSKINSAGTFDPNNPLHLRADINNDATIDTLDRDAAWANRQQRTDTLSIP
jgi:hypothetical protein